MIEHICRICGKTKAPADMYVFKGNIQTQCKDCNSKARSVSRTKGSGGGRAVDVPKVALAKTAGSSKSKAIEKFKLDLPSAFGFRAQIAESGDRLVLEQDDADGNTDEILLTRVEAKQLFDGFEEWANS